MSHCLMSVVLLVLSIFIIECAKDPNLDVDVAPLLIKCQIRSEEDIEGMSAKDQRNTLITEANKKKGIPVKELQGKKNSELKKMMANCTAVVDDEHCGNRPESFRIVNGREATPHSWPWMASIIEVTPDETKHICGGTLISPTKILTAAHCFRFKTNTSEYKVRLGAHKLSKIMDHEVERVVTKIEMHDKYRYQPASPYDIALLSLDEQVEISAFVSPLCLGKPKQLPPGSVTCYVIGWGRTSENNRSNSDVLLELELPILPKDECKKMLGDKFDKDSQVCGAYENGGKDACQGDSGGPLVCEDKKADKWRLQGIVSWGKGCAREGNPGVYTRVSYYRDWVIQHIANGTSKFY